MPKKDLVRRIDQNITSQRSSRYVPITISQTTGLTLEEVLEIVNGYLDGLGYSRHLGPSCTLLEAVSVSASSMVVSANIFRSGSIVVFEHYSTLNPIDEPVDRVGYEIVLVTSAGVVSGAGYSYDITRAQLGTTASIYPAKHTECIQLGYNDALGGYIIFNSGAGDAEEASQPNFNAWEMDSGTVTWKLQYGHIKNVQSAFKNLFPEVTTEQWDTWGFAMHDLFASGRIVGNSAFFMDTILSRESVEARPFDQVQRAQIGRTTVGDGLALHHKGGRPWFWATHPFQGIDTDEIISDDLASNLETLYGEVIDSFLWEADTDTFQRTLGKNFHSSNIGIAFNGFNPIALPAIEGEINSVGLNNLLIWLDNYGLVDRQTNFVYPVKWYGIWIPTEYQENSMVRDGNWTMIALRYTTDRASPYAVGESAFGVADDATWILGDYSSSYLLSGQLYHFLEPGWISAYRIYIPSSSTDFDYRVVFVDWGDPVNPVYTTGQLIDGSDVEVGWMDINLPFKIVSTNDVIEIELWIQDNSAITTLATDWNYIRPTTHRNPVSGEVIHSDSSPNLLSIHQLDNGALDRGVFLATLVRGSRIAYNSKIWTVLKATDNGTYFDFEIIPEVLATEGLGTFTLTTYSTATLPYAKVTDYWDNNPHSQMDVRGHYEYDGTTGDVGDAVSVDIQFQPGEKSDDWDIVAYSPLSGGIGGGNTGTLPPGEIDFSFITLTNPSAAVPDYHYVMWVD